MKRFRFSWILLTLILVALGGCSESKSAPGAKPPAPVSVARAEVKNVPVVLEAVGQVDASSTVTLRSQVAGVIAAVDFREGDEVRKGDVLFTLDQRPYQAALAKAEAELQQQRAAAANARRDATRYGTLRSSGFVSGAEADTVLANADSLDAAVAAAQANVDNARIELDYCTIRAPQAGRTGALLVHPGTVVKANDLPDLVTINTLQPVTVSFNVPEANLEEIRRHLDGGALAVSALVPGGEGTPEQGRISFLDNTVDPATGTIRLKGTFVNANRRLWPGQFVTVKLVLTILKGAVTVPTAALLTGQQGTYLFVLANNDRVTAQPVDAGIASGDTTVIRSGIAPGTTVVTEGQQRLADGSRVVVKAGAEPKQVSQQ